MNLFDLSAALTLAFGVGSLVDGVYLHLWRFRLHARPESRREHVIHGLRGLLFVPTLLFVLSGTTSGAWLWVGVAAVALDLVVTIWDVLEERRSRVFQRGLPRYEFALHVVLTAFHVGAIAASLAARPAAAWVGTTTVHVGAAQLAELVAVRGMLPGAVFITIAHAVLMHPRFRMVPATV